MNQESFILKKLKFELKDTWSKVTKTIYGIKLKLDTAVSKLVDPPT